MSVETISIQGQVNGNITAKDKIELKATARLHGDIRAKRLTVEDGVTFVGKVEVNPTGTSAGNPPQTKAADEKVTPTDDAEASESQGKGMFRR